MRLPALLGMGGLLSAFLLNFDPSGTVNATDSTTPVDGKASLSLELIDEAGVQWQIPAGTTKLSVLAVGGGGGGAPGLGNAAGGGGAGGLVFVENYLEKFNARPGDAIEVKAGMPGAIPNPHKDRRGLPGSNSCFGKIVALGGGGGGRGQNLEPVHHASSGGSAGGGNMGDKIPMALQPAESGFGIGFGHPGGGASGSGGGGAGGPGTVAGKGGGGIGLQGVPQDLYIDKASGFATVDFDANNQAHYKVMFRDLFGSGIGEDGWFAGGGAYNAPNSKDKGGRGGGSAVDRMPHTGGGGAGSTHGYQGGEAGIGGSGVVLVRCHYADGSVKICGWGRVQPEELISKAMLREPGYLLNQGKYDAALEVLGKQNNLDKLPIPVQAKILRIYGQIYAGAGQEKEASAKFKEALELEKK
jgi:hypothetical protein